jgi:hypothetical protein
MCVKSECPINISLRRYGPTNTVMGVHLYATTHMSSEMKSMKGLAADTEQN